MSGARRVADALVLGGGVIGAAAALALAERGLRVSLVERFQPGHRHGSSHGDGRIFRFSYPEAVYVALAERAAAGWRRLGTVAGEELLLPGGHWDGGPAGCRELADIEAAITGSGLACRRLSAEESNRRFPRLRLPPGSEALYQGDGGVLRAGRAVAALWRLARRAGVGCHPGEAVTRLDGGDGGIEATTASGRRFAARRLVLAAGAWSRDLAAGLGLDLPLRVTQEQVAYFPPRNDVDHGPGALPSFVDHHASPPFYGLPLVEIPGVKVGRHHAGPALASADRRLPADAGETGRLRRFAAERLPDLAVEPVCVETCLYTTTPDRHFLLDRHPALPQVVLAAGFSGHGFKFAPAIGEITAALALGEEPPVALGTFALGRFAGRAAAAPSHPGGH